MTMTDSPDVGARISGADFRRRFPDCLSSPSLTEIRDRRASELCSVAQTFRDIPRRCETHTSTQYRTHQAVDARQHVDA